ncbi:hypothetical protein QBZ16_005323 [Prototheca wickerhamii]|uniref:Uncharacterized protein n=1 Tax=Prototheca wickerhamii TaxID=3111 RepID=A0AAD9MKL2_PROWI|nr:hypothetical protein QBZ16_005323 [Prototheca wickerhamii]
MAAPSIDAGVASMQSGCDNSLGVTGLARGGAVGYLAPIECSKFFRYAWWSTFYTFAVWATILAFLVTVTIHKPGLIGLIVISMMLLMNTANTFLFFNDVQTGDSTFTAGTRTTVAGSIIIVFAEFFLIFLIGLHDEEASWESGFKAARAASKPPKDETPSGRAYATSAFEARGSPPTSRPQSPPTSQA